MWLCVCLCVSLSVRDYVCFWRVCLCVCVRACVCLSLRVFVNVVLITPSSTPPSEKMSVAAIMSADDAWKALEAAAMSNTWDGEMRVVSKHAEGLLQLDNGIKIPPAGKVQNRLLEFLIFRHCEC